VCTCTSESAATSHRRGSQPVACHRSTLTRRRPYGGSAPRSAPSRSSRSSTTSRTLQSQPRGGSQAHGLSGMALNRQAKLIELHSQHRQLPEDGGVLTAQAQHGVAAVTEQAPDPPSRVAVVDVPALRAGISRAAAPAAALLDGEQALVILRCQPVLAQPSAFLMGAPRLARVDPATVADGNARLPRALWDIRAALAAGPISAVQPSSGPCVLVAGAAPLAPPTEPSRFRRWHGRAATFAAGRRARWPRFVGAVAGFQALSSASLP
jgi:hypothetical protein